MDRRVSQSSGVTTRLRGRDHPEVGRQLIQEAVVTGAGDRHVARGTWTNPERRLARHATSGGAKKEGR